MPNEDGPAMDCVPEQDAAATLPSRALMTVQVAVGKPVDLGMVDGRQARMMPIVGGTVTGDYQGVVLPGGADWQDIGPDGTIEIRARYVLQLDEGLVEVRSDGWRHAAPDVMARLARGEAVPASDYYFRTSMTFRSAAAPLARLNAVLGVAMGERTPAGVQLKVYEIL